MNDDYAAALGFLYGRIDYERTPTIPYQERHLRLERMRALLRLVGDPQAKLAVIHVAGSKGKGSTATMIATVLTAAGQSTGLYTSPHLNALEERIRVDGTMCAAEDLVELVNLVRPAVARMDETSAAAGDADGQPTYFEIVTAMALLYFRQRQVDYAVLEVGLGGRLDSTNICRPRVSVITSISLDHTMQLGNTLTSIAREKAGILKTGVPLVHGIRSGAARQVIDEMAAACGCPNFVLGADFDFTYHLGPGFAGGLSGKAVPDSRTAGAYIDYLPVHDSLGAPLYEIAQGMLGHHQAANAAVAVTSLRLLAGDGLRVSESALREGIADARCPARTELVSTAPAVILDGAHNGASIQALLSVLDESFGGRPRIMVFATTRGKDVHGMLSQLVDSCQHLLFTQYHDNPRSYPAKQLIAAFSALPTPTAHKRPHVQTWLDPRDAWYAARKIATPDHVICITGSFFLAAELRPIILAQP